MAEMTDAELMQRVRTGDESAFGDLVERYMDRLVGYLARVSGSRARAEDLAQETFLRLYQNSAAYVEDGRLAGFLYRIATNLLLAEERRLTRRSLIDRVLRPFRGDGAGPQPSQETEFLAQEAQRQVAEALTGVPLAWRAPLVLHVIEGLPFTAIAEALGCPEGTVKSRVSRGRAMLKRRLAPYFERRGG